MKRYLSIIIIALLIGACNDEKPVYANVKAVQSGIKFAPSLDVLVQGSILSVSIVLDGTSVYDTSYSLEEHKAEELYEELKQLGIDVYSDETPEWRNKRITIVKSSDDEKFKALFALVSKFDGYYENLYWTLNKAAEDLSKPNPSAESQINGDVLKPDTLKAD